MMRMTAAITALVMLTACGGAADDNSADSGQSAASGGGERWHPVQRYCVTREATGSMTGQIEECSCEWGQTRYEIENIQISMMGFNQDQNKHTIYKDDQIYSWDPATRQGSQIANPMADALDGNSGDPEEMGRAFIEAMGGTYTDQTKTIAGEVCTVVDNPQFGGDMCVTDDALVLEMNVSMGPVNMSQVATSVSRNSCGDPANYEVPADVTLRAVTLPF